METTIKKHLTPLQYAKREHIHVKTVRLWCRIGKINSAICTKTGRYLIFIDDLGKLGKLGKR